MRSSFLPGLLLILLSARTADAVDARMLRFPDVSRSHVVFVHAGDLWLVPKSGGRAERLSTPPGEELLPKFSPDGLEVAFTANYDGNLDVYVMPVSGGLPHRLTHHPQSDRVVDWHPDGESVIHATGMTSERQRYNQMHRVSRNGGLPERLPIPYGDFGGISPDGRVLAYVPSSRDFRTWKRYRGGRTSDIWLFDLEELTAKNITDDNNNDSLPMWHGTRLYFLSDRGPHARNNLWSYETTSASFRQVTFFEEHDVRFPSIGPDDIVFEHAGGLHLLDLRTERHSEIRVSLLTDRTTLKPRRRDVSRLIASASVSPSGKRVVVEARGDLYTVPAEHGVIHALTRTSGVAERHPSWSPDGQHVAYFSDRTGEYELTTRPSDGSGEERTITSLGPGYRYSPHWSPDSDKVAFIDQTMKIQIVDVSSRRVTDVDRARSKYHGALSRFRGAWSPDSDWYAYSREVDNQHDAIFLHDVRTGKSHQVTSGYYNDTRPTFDPKGRYLYYLSDRSFSPIYSDIDTTWIYANTTRVVAVPLRDDLASPLAPRNDVEPVESNGDSDDDEDEESKSKGSRGKSADTRIDLEDFEARGVELPLKAGNYSSLAALDGMVLAHRRPRTGSGTRQSSLVSWNLKKREEKAFLSNVDGFTLSADGKKMLVARSGSFYLVNAKPNQKLDKKLRTSELVATVDPAQEWRQIFDDAWRFERDFFYDPNMHGVDWDAMRERYGAMLDDCVTRRDVNVVIGEMIAELSASHAYRGGGDVEQPTQVSVGLLGADFELDRDTYRFRRILETAPWDSLRSPLREPGVDVSEGTYLLAVNGIPVDTAKDPWAAFQGLAGKVVTLTVSDRPTERGSREVLVKTLTGEGWLRTLAWIEANRRRVAEATDDRVGYVYVPSTGRGGQNELVRQWRAQVDKEGLIIDERFNSGGQIPDRFIELLNRPRLNYWGVRDGVDWQWPPVAHEGPKVMLINSSSGSGGDAFPYYFRKAGLGPLIGTRTWGGLIGLTGSPRLIDGGTVTVPTFGIYSTEGNWIIEGHGVDPDIEVVDDPAQLARGIDPQLERAITEVQRLLTRSAPRRPAKPTYPDRASVRQP